MTATGEAVGGLCVIMNPCQGEAGIDRARQNTPPEFLLCLLNTNRAWAERGPLPVFKHHTDVVGRHGLLMDMPEWDSALGGLSSLSDPFEIISGSPQGH